MDWMFCGIARIWEMQFATKQSLGWYEQDKSSNVTFAFFIRLGGWWFRILEGSGGCCLSCQECQKSQF
jgi:hypothetical protein